MSNSSFPAGVSATRYCRRSSHAAARREFREPGVDEDHAQWELPAVLAHDDALSDFMGHLIGISTLHSRAAQRGYHRGAFHEKGWYGGYDKHFPALQLSARLAMTPAHTSDRRRTVALQDLHFVSLGEVTDQRSGLFDEPPVPLADVPAVLLSECVNDWRYVAAGGSGFDAQWEAKTDPNLDEGDGPGA